MEYAGFEGYRYSEIAGEEVGILRYESKDKIPYCDCTRCGKPIRRKMWVVQSRATDVELMYLGAECIKHLR